jgi:hypothetical protein
MSRTKRRMDRETPSWLLYGFKGLHKVKYSPTEVSCEIAKYHSDSGKCMSVPAWFRKDINKQFRTKMNRETRKMFKTGDYENYLYDVNHNTVEWLWW